MPDPPGFKSGQNVHARMAHASETKTVKLFGEAKSTVITDSIWERRKKSSWKKLHRSDRDLRTVAPGFKKDLTNTFLKITAEINEPSFFKRKCVKGAAETRISRESSDSKTTPFIKQYCKAFIVEWKPTEPVPRTGWMLFFQTSHSLLYFRYLVEYRCGDGLKKHLIQTVFFQLIGMEEALWRSALGLYLGNLPAQWFLFIEWSKVMTLQNLSKKFHFKQLSLAWVRSFSIKTILFQAIQLSINTPLECQNSSISSNLV